MLARIEKQVMDKAKQTKHAQLAFDYQAEREYYDNPITQVHAYAWMDADLRTWVPDYPDIFKGKRILDIGAGEVLQGILICERYQPTSYVAIELILHRMLGACTRMDASGRLQLTCGDCYHLPFQEHQFDIVLGNGVLHHLPNLPDVAAQIARMLKPGGIYLGREPNFLNPGVKWRVLGGHRSLNEHVISAADVEQAFAQFQCNVRINYFWRRFPWLHHPWLSTSIAIYGSFGK